MRQQSERCRSHGQVRRGLLSNANAMVFRVPAVSDSFYDELAESYHLIFDDWNAAIARQREVHQFITVEKLEAILAPFCVVAHQFTMAAQPTSQCGRPRARRLQIRPRP